MSRDLIPFVTDDMSALARALRRELTRFGTPADVAADAELPVPSHLALLNMLARASGYRNFQHLRAQHAARERLDQRAPPPAAAPVDYVQVERLARYFDPAGQFTRWPGKHSHRLPCLWVLWSRLAPRRVYSERELNDVLNAEHRFGDHALLRRALCDHGLMTRTPDGRQYRRVEQAPPPLAAALIRHLGRRLAA